jgi:nicotinamide riboside transporter PnuC
MSDIINYIGWLVAVASIIGNILVIKKRRSGFMVWIISNIVWVAIDCHKEIYSQAVLFTIFTIIAAYGWIKWKKDNEKLQLTNSYLKSKDFGEIE